MVLCRKQLQSTGQGSGNGSRYGLSHIQVPTNRVVLPAPTALFWGVGNTSTKKLSDGSSELETL